MRTRTAIVSASNSQPGHSLPVAPRPDARECVSPFLIRSAAPSTTSFPSQGQPALVDTLNSILSPPHRLYAPQSGILPHTTPEPPRAVKNLKNSFHYHQTAPQALLHIFRRSALPPRFAQRMHHYLLLPLFRHRRRRRIYSRLALRPIKPRISSHIVDLAAPRV